MEAESLRVQDRNRCLAPLARGNRREPPVIVITGRGRDEAVFEKVRADQLPRVVRRIAKTFPFTTVGDTLGEATARPSSGHMDDILDKDRMTYLFVVRTDVLF